MDFQSALFRLLLFIPAFVAALTIHEFAHAWAGHRLGDDTAERQGRLTMDPLAHLDPFGCLIIVIAVISNWPLMGWAKPVPFNPSNLRNPRRDSMLIALAGPVSNLIQVPIWLGALWLLRLVAQRSNPDIGISVLQGLSETPDLSNMYGLLGTVLAFGVVINIGLAAFNMIPIPPLDGHYILEALGPPFITDFYNAIRPWSFIVLYVLLLTHTINTILDPVYRVAYGVVALALGISWF